MLLILLPVLLPALLLTALNAAILGAFGLTPLAIFALAWGLLCFAEIVAVPIVARRRGRDPGIWVLVTIIWLCFDTFLAAFAHLAGFVVFGSIFVAVHASQSEGGAEAAILASAIGVLALTFVALIVYLPLWALLLSSQRPLGEGSSKVRRGRYSSRR